jgi:glycosyltransferase involved in cell wall biosynthesis
VERALPDAPERPEATAAPLVTILISSYNYEGYVLQAIESALDQTYKNIEVLVTDDGSTDRSWELIQDFAEKRRDPRLRIFRHENRGALQTTIFGVSEAKGEFIALLASDDFFYPDKIARQVHIFRNSPPSVAMVHTGAYADYGDGDALEVFRDFVPLEGGSLETILSLEGTAIASTIMLRRHALDAVGGFDPTIFAEDIDLFAAMAAAGYEFRYDPAPLVQKRFARGSLSSRVEECFDAHFRILDKHRGRLSSEQQWRIENKLHHWMGQAAASQGQVGLAFRSYLTAAKRTRNPAHMFRFMQRTGRYFLARAVPASARPFLRRARARMSGGQAAARPAGAATCR